MMMKNREYYLSLPYSEKLKALRDAIKVDFQYYLILASYYLEATIEQGGLPTETIEKEFEKGLKRNHYFKNNINE
jgi:hypothetical protein